MSASFAVIRPSVELYENTLTATRSASGAMPETGVPVVPVPPTAMPATCVPCVQPLIATGHGAAEPGTGALVGVITDGHDETYPKPAVTKQPSHTVFDVAVRNGCPTTTPESITATVAPVPFLPAVHAAPVPSVTVAFVDDGDTDGVDIVAPMVAVGVKVRVAFTASTVADAPSASRPERSTVIGTIAMV